MMSEIAETWLRRGLTGTCESGLNLEPKFRIIERA
jgi:hypothetical protein